MNYPLLHFVLNNPGVTLILERPRNAPALGRQVRITAKASDGGTASLVADEDWTDDQMEYGMKLLRDEVRNG